MYAVALDGGRKARERSGREREAAPESERSARLFGREICERDFRRVAFLASQAGPEGRVNDRLDRGRVRLGR